MTAAELRPAQVQDAEALFAIERSVGGSWALSNFQKLCLRQQTATALLVAELSGRLVGFIAYNWVLDTGSILNIVVHPDAQRCGLGARLVTQALADLQQRGASNCQLEVRQSNAAAIALYTRLGFRRDGQRRNYYPTADSGREHALLMSRQAQGD